MTIGDEIFALLGPLVSDRVFPTWADANAVKPYITYGQLSYPEDAPTLDGKINLAEIEFEFHCWANDYDQSTELALEVLGVLRDYKSEAVRMVVTQGREDRDDPELAARASRVRALFYMTEE